MKYLILFFSLFLSDLAQAQLPTEIKNEDAPFERLRLRHVKGKVGLEASYGLSKFGPYFGVGYVNFLNDKLIFNPNIKYELGTIGTSRFEQYAFFMSLQRTFYHYKQLGYFNAGLAPGLHVQKADNEIVNKHETFFPMGVSVDANIEVFITNGVVLKIEASEIFSNDKFGFCRFIAGAGIRVYFK
jgi:hypothetical protein